MKVGGRLFCHKNAHKWTWRTESQVRLRGTRQPVRRVFWQLSDGAIAQRNKNPATWAGRQLDKHSGRFALSKVIVKYEEQWNTK